MAKEPLKIYIAGSNNKKAMVLKDFLKSKIKDIEFTSVWHDAKQDIRLQRLVAGDKKKIANRNYDQISACDILILVSDLDHVPGGKFVEAGIALGMGKSVLAVGYRENTLLYHDQVVECETLEQIHVEFAS